MLTFYITGMVVSFILGLIIMIKERKDNPDMQYGMIGAMALLSWITVVLLIWKRKDIFFKN